MRTLNFEIWDRAGVDVLVTGMAIGALNASIYIAVVAVGSAMFGIATFGGP